MSDDEIRILKEAFRPIELKMRLAYAEYQEEININTSNERLEQMIKRHTEKKERLQAEEKKLQELQEKVKVMIETKPRSKAQNGLASDDALKKFELITAKSAYKLTVADFEAFRVDKEPMFTKD